MEAQCPLCKAMNRVPEGSSLSEVKCRRCQQRFAPTKQTVGLESSERRVTGETAILGQRIRRVLEQHKGVSEDILFCIIGVSADQAAVAMDKRLLILKSGFLAGATFGCRVTSVYYKDITSIEVNTGMLNGVIEICTASYPGTKDKDFWAVGRDRSPWKLSNCIPITKLDLNKYQPYLDRLRKLIANAKEDSPTDVVRGKDVASQIERLYRLHKSGALTKDEFDQTKKRLLS